MKNINYRAATNEDVDFLAQLLVNAAEASGVELRVSDLPAHPDTYQYVEGFPNESDVGVVAETCEGDLVGAAWVRLLPTEAHAINEALPELTMAVVADYQRKGIGSALLDALYRAVAAAGIRKIALGVHKDNVAAIGLYRQQNWEEDGFFQQYIMMSKVVGD